MNITILESAVVAAIVTATFNLYKQKNESIDKYVIEQRSLWRKKIRSIANRIKVATYQNYDKILMELETQINAYGLRSSNSDLKDLDSEILKDRHIHNIISSISNFDEYNERKKHLFNLVSYLLKFDWERNKRDIRTKNNIYAYLLLGMISLFAMYSQYLNVNQVSMVALLISLMFSTIGIWNVLLNKSTAKKWPVFVLTTLAVALYIKSLTEPYSPFLQTIKFYAPFLIKIRKCALLSFMEPYLIIAAPVIGVIIVWIISENTKVVEKIYVKEVEDYLLINKIYLRTSDRYMFNSNDEK